MDHKLVLQESHFNRLCELLLNDGNLERPAILLCGRSKIDSDLWGHGSELNFLSYEVIEIPSSEIIENSDSHVIWDTTTLRRTMKVAKNKNLAICLVHNHPNGALRYSGIDDSNEPDLIKSIYNRNGGDEPHLSLVITQEKKLFGRVWYKDLTSKPFEFIKVLGEKFKIHGYMSNLKSYSYWDRQSRAFGSDLTDHLQSLTIGVIGNGATGSITAIMLARLGVGKLVLIDKDTVEDTNLNRLHGSTLDDANNQRYKYAVLKDHIESFGLNTKIIAKESWVGDSENRDALKSCDFIFGCTDDDSGRLFLNRFAYFYLCPVFDMGISIIPLGEKDLHSARVLGRMTVVETSNVCLTCQGIINLEAAREEDTKRSDPSTYKDLKKQGYVQGSDVPDPSVITFTSGISCTAINEFINRFVEFKVNGTRSNISIDFSAEESRKPRGVTSDGCPLCDQKIFWGRGDISPFLDKAY